MSDLYQQLNANREVPSRTQDGFRNNTNDIEQVHEDSDAVANSDALDYLVETAKSKLLTLEVSLRQQLEQHLFDNPDIR